MTDETGISAIFLQHGPWGAAVLALGIAVIMLYKRVQFLADKRVEDALALTERYRLALSENTQTTEALTHALERLPPR